MYKIFSLLHKIIAWAMFIVVVPAAGLYAWEKSHDFKYYIEYFHIVPYATHYDSGKYAKFHSFYDSKQSIDIEWQEIIFCDVGDGAGFEYAETVPGEEFDFIVDRTYTPEIWELLKGIGDGSVQKDKKVDDLLREYATSTQVEGFGYSKIGAWRLNLSQPEDGSTCYGRHKIRIYTPFFSIEKDYELYSGKWTYGIKED